LDKKIFGVYLAKEGVPDNEAHAKLDLPASPWELWDAMDKVRLQDGETLYLEIDDYYAFDVLAPHLVNMDISLNGLNDLAGELARLDTIQGIAYRGLLEMAVQEKVQANSGIITMQELRDLAVSAGADCCHVVDAADDAQLGRFYAENDFVPELEGVPDAAFELLDFAKIGKILHTGEGGIYVGGCYVVRDGGLLAAPPCPRELPEKPGYLFRLTLGLHPDYGDDRMVTLDLPASEKELEEAQEHLGTLQWENTVVLDYDGIIPNVAAFADLPMEMEEFNEFACAVKNIPARQVQLPKLKALLEQFEVQDIGTAILLVEHMDEYILTPDLSSPQETAVDQLRFLLDDAAAEQLIPHVNLFTYGNEVIQHDNAALTPYGLLHRADYQPMQTPVKENMNMKM
jgi:hypothetical protein